MCQWWLDLLLAHWLLGTKGTKLMSSGNTALATDYQDYPTMQEYHKPFNEPVPEGLAVTPETAQAMFAKLLEAFKAMPGMLTQISDLKEELNNVYDGHTELEADLRKERENVADLTANYAALERERDELREANRHLNEKVTAVISQRDQSDQNSESLRVERDTLFADRDQWRASSQDAWGRCEQLQTSLSEVTIDRDLASANYKTVSDERDRIADKLNKLREVLNS